MALINYQGPDARAIDGEFDHSGLYQMLPDGTIQTIVITFTTDEEGNQTAHENTVTLGDAKTFVTENFIMLQGCTYYDKDGDRFQMTTKPNPGEETFSGVAPINEFLIINKRTKQIYAFDGEEAVKNNSPLVNIAASTNRLIECDENQVLMCRESYAVSAPTEVWRISFAGSTASGTLLNPGGYGFFCSSNSYIVTPFGGTIYSSDGRIVSALFPQGGYNTVNDAFLLSDGQVWTLMCLNNECIIYDVKLSGASVTKEELKRTEINQHYISYDGYCEGKENVVLNIGETLLIYNRTNGSLTTSTDIPQIYLSPLNVFDGKCWEIRQTDFSVEAKWFDPDALTTGTLPTRLPDGLDRVNVTLDCKAGCVNITAIRKSDFANVAMSVSLKTGAVTTEVSVPQNTTVTLTPLN